MPLLAQFNEHAKLSMLRNATWTLSNFCRGKPQPHFEQVRIVRFLEISASCSYYCLSLFADNNFLKLLSRPNLPYPLWHVLYTQMMKKFWLMHAGHFHIFLMVLTTKFKLLLMPVFALVLLSFSCKWSALFFNYICSYLRCFFMNSFISFWCERN